MSRFFYYANFWAKYLTRTFDDLTPSESYIKKNAIDIDYYCKINNPFRLDVKNYFKDINLTKNSGYSYDIYNILYPYRRNIAFNFLPGDITSVPDVPSFVKSRPINGNNENSVLLPLDSFRHLKFVDDKLNFRSKQNKIVWRGAAYQEHRLRFLENCGEFPFIDVGNTASSDKTYIPFSKPKMSIKEQLNFKFIVSLEGNDVATNLKWIMSSNSVCIMPKPKFETWFKEGTLLPNIHYIEIKDDYSNLEEVFQKYSNRIEDCEAIIRNANKFANGFKDKLNNLTLARTVALKYKGLLEM